MAQAQGVEDGSQRQVAEVVGGLGRRLALGLRVCVCVWRRVRVRDVVRTSNGGGAGQLVRAEGDVGGRREREEKERREGTLEVDSRSHTSRKPRMCNKTSLGRSSKGNVPRGGCDRGGRLASARGSPGGQRRGRAWLRLSPTAADLEENRVGQQRGRQQARGWACRRLPLDEATATTARRRRRAPQPGHRRAAGGGHRACWRGMGRARATGAWRHGARWGSMGLGRADEVSPPPA